MNSNTVNLFFACDDGYIPFLAVALHSIKLHRDENRLYSVTVLHTGVSEQSKEKICSAFSDEKFAIHFNDISESVETISKRLFTRDYYSKSTYFRLFIPDLYPKIDKALYLDCDIVLNADVAELYDVEIGNDLVGAVSDAFVNAVPRLHGYVTERIGVSTPKDYFNAGVLLMNLRKMRAVGFEDNFIDLIAKVKFEVAQDQDYLNVLCNKKRTTVGDEWNFMPGFSTHQGENKLIHFNLDNKPWHKDGVEFADLFWKHANNCCYAKEIAKIHETYKENKKSAKETVNLIDLAEMQGKDEKTNLEIRKMLESIRM